MVEALKVKSMAYQQRWGEAAEPLKLIERSKILVENLQMRDVIKEQDDCARKAVRERLNAVYAEHADKGLIRSGTTLRVGIEVFEEEAGKLIENLVREVSALARNAGAFALVTEGVEQFLSLLDGELGRIVKKVEYEIQDVGRSRGFARAAEILWAEKRAGLLEKLELMRSEFMFPPDRESSGDQVDIQPQESDPPAEPHFDYPGQAEDDDLPMPECVELPAPDDVELQVPEDAEAQAGPAEDQPAEAADSGQSNEPESAPAVEPEADPVNEPETVHVEAQDSEPEDEAHDQPAVTGQDRDPQDSMAPWHDMWADIAARLWSGKLQPEGQSDLVEAMTEWFGTRGQEASETELRDCARRLWSKYAASQRITSRISDAVRHHRENQAAARFEWLTAQLDTAPRAAIARPGPANGDESTPVFRSRAGSANDLTAPALDID